MLMRIRIFVLRMDFLTLEILLGGEETLLGKARVDQADVSRVLLVSKIPVSAPQNPCKDHPVERLQYKILLEYMSSRICGNTEILDYSCRRLMLVCGRHITMHI